MIMRKNVLLAFGVAGLATAMLLPTNNVQAASGNVDFFVGTRKLDKDFGSDRNIEEQDAFAVFSDFGGSDWPVHIAINLISGNKDRNDDELDVKLDGSSGEIDLGGRWYPMKDSPWMPHLGAGLGLMSGKVETDGGGVNDVAFDDSKLGYWAEGGVGYRFGGHFKVGARVHYGKAKIDQKDDSLKEINAGGVTYGVNAGFTW